MAQNNNNSNTDKLVVGIVGKIGCGKSSVSNILKEKYGFVSLEVDRYGHKALIQEKQHITDVFGNKILDDNSEINRQKLGEIVFSDTLKLAKLNSIVHPRIKTEIISDIANSNSQRFVIDAALLFEIGLDELCNYIISVDAPDEQIIYRVTKYRGWSEAKVKSILKAQTYLEFLKERTNYIIFNNKDKKKLSKQIEFFVLEIL